MPIIKRTWLLRHEVYTYTLADESGRKVIWDISRAKELVAQHRAELPKLEVTRDQLEVIVQHYEFEEARVGKADLAYPGIAAPIILQEPGVEPYICFVLIDGIHRAVRAYRENLRMDAYALSDLQSWSCLMYADPWTVPLTAPDGTTHPNRLKPMTNITLDRERAATGDGPELRQSLGFYDRSEPSPGGYDLAEGLLEIDPAEAARRLKKTKEVPDDEKP